MAPGCTVGRKQVSGDSVKPWVLAFMWMLLSLILCTYLTLFQTKTTVFLNGSGFFKQDNAHCSAAKIIQEWFE